MQIDNKTKGLKKLPLYKIDNIETLKTIGKYNDVKNWIEEEIECSLNVKDWTNLFNKISHLSLSVNENIEKLLFILDKDNLKKIGSLKEAKKEIDSILAFQIKARSWKQLEKSLKSIVVAFRNRDKIDKSAIFEKNKLQNFIASSRLEGIYMTNKPVSDIKEIINKYKCES